MPYTSRYNGPDLTPEESEVKSALRQYTTDPATEFDWVPIAALRRTYRTWKAEQRARRWHDPDALLPALTVRQFGRAMRRVFPGISPCRRRSYCGRQQWGYAYLIGPASIRTKRPPHYRNRNGEGRSANEKIARRGAIDSHPIVPAGLLKVGA